MSVPLIILLNGLAVTAILIYRELRLMDKVNRWCLPANHPRYRPLTARERRRAGLPPPTR